MPANTRLMTTAAIALTSMLAVMTSATVAIIDRGTNLAQVATVDRSVTTLRAAIRTEGLSPADARRSLEARSAALAQWLRPRGGSMRVISSSGLLRTHGPDGLRLTSPQAYFERVLEIQVPDNIEFAHTQRALLGPDGSVVIASANATRHGQSPRHASAGFSEALGVVPGM
jgi:hypothetical protein